MAIDLTQLPKTQLARRIAEQLGETHPDPLSKIRHIVMSHGKRYAVKLLTRTQQIEADGGWVIIEENTLPSRRSPTSVYLKLHQVYQRSSQKRGAQRIESA